MQEHGTELKLVFFEAKHFANQELKSRSGAPRVFKQTDKYERLLERSQKDIVNAYRRHCADILDSNCVPEKSKPFSHKGAGRVSEAIDLQKILNETIDGVIASVRFLVRYFQEVLLVAFRPRKFADGFLTIPEGRRRSSGATLFLFTTILILEVCVGVADRVIDASKSTDVGAGILLQSGVIWELSWEALLKSTMPVSLGLLGAGWIISRLCGKERIEQAWLRDIFPYVLWRSVVLSLVISVFVGLGISLLPFVSILIAGGMAMAILIVPLLVFLGVLLIPFLTLRRLAPFMAMLRGDRSDIANICVRSFLFRLGALSSLIIPIWWSYLALSPAAAKVAASPDTTLVLADDLTHFSVTINLRNFSGHPLAATKTGTVLQWWDDENPVMETGFLTRTRVPNGSIMLELPAETKLTEGFQTLTYSGDVSQASLTPRSFGDFDIMGGPEVERPSPAEYDATRKSFEKILNRYRKGRIEVTFEAITEGGKTSERTIDLLSNERR